jgi:hypothetical protein
VKSCLVIVGSNCWTLCQLKDQRHSMNCAVLSMPLILTVRNRLPMYSGSPSGRRKRVADSPKFSGKEVFD